MSLKVPIAVLLVFLAAGPSLGQELSTQYADDPNPTATVRIISYGTHGHLMDAPEVLLFEGLHTGANFGTRFRNGVSHGVPFGKYLLRARIPGFYDDIAIVSVSQDPTVAIIGFQLGRIDSPGFPYLLRGRVTGDIPSQKATFVKLIGVYSSVSMQSQISATGEFQFVGLPDGLFVMLVVNEDGILAARQVDFGADKPNVDGLFEIRIGQGLQPSRR